MIVTGAERSYGWTKLGGAIDVDVTVGAGYVWWTAKFNDWTIVIGDANGTFVKARNDIQRKLLAIETACRKARGGK